MSHKGLLVQSSMHNIHAGMVWLFLSVKYQRIFKYQILGQKCPPDISINIWTWIINYCGKIFWNIGCHIGPDMGQHKSKMVRYNWLICNFQTTYNNQLLDGSASHSVVCWRECHWVNIMSIHLHGCGRVEHCCNGLDYIFSHNIFHGIIFCYCSVIQYNYFAHKNIKILWPRTLMANTPIIWHGVHKPWWNFEVFCRKAE